VLLYNKVKRFPDKSRIVTLCVMALLKDVYSMKHCNVTTTGMDIICDCSNHGYRVVPTHIPHNVTILDLSGNRLTFETVIAH
jgi:hypothetical protein